MSSSTDIIIQNSTVSFNTVSPLSYNEWILQNARVAVDDSLEGYNQYIYNWYKVNEVSSLSNTLRVKADYIALLKELTLFITDEEKNLFLKEIDFTNDIDIIYAIPFFVKKLKTIALTIAARREDTKNTKFKYNLIGSTKGVETILYESLLKAFTSSNNSTQLSINALGTAFPELSSVKNDLIIEIEELYDPSAYTSESYNNIYHTTIPRVYDNPLSEIFNIFVEQYAQGVLPLSAFNEYTANSSPRVYNEININTKYIGNDLYTLSVSSIPSVVIQANAPYLNLNNTHFANIAVYPNTLKFINKSKVGGYLLPHKIGVPYYLGHGFTNKINKSKINDIANKLFLNPEIYTSNRGLTEKDQISPYETTHVDNAWIRESNTASKKSGLIVGAINYQKFVPYQSSYETLKTNIYGVSRQDDVFEFWSGYNSNIWNDEKSYPLNYKKEGYRVAERAEKLLVTEKISSDWATDIYGNNYIILKNNISKISSLRESVGELWVRDINNIINPGNISLEPIYNAYANLTNHYQELIQNKIISINIFEDNMILRTNYGVSINKFSYDLINNVYSNNSILQSFVNLAPGTIYGGYWYDEASKLIYINAVEMINSGVNTRFIYSIYIYNGIDGTLNLYLQDTIMSAVFISQVSNIKVPIIFKYNSDNSTFNTSFIFNTFDIYSIDVKNYKDNPHISSVTLIH